MRSKLSCGIMFILAAAFLFAGCSVLEVEEATEGFESQATSTESNASSTQSPTPEETGPDIAEQVRAPGRRYAASWGEEGLSVEANAVVSVPDVQSMPQVRVEAMEFTTQKVEAAVEFLYGDTPLYEYQEGVFRSDELIGQEIANLEEVLPLMEEDEYKAETEARLEELRKLLAQPVPEPKLWDGEMEDVPVELPGGGEDIRTEVGLYSMEGAKVKTTFSVSNDPAVDDILSFLYEIQDGGAALKTGAVLRYMPEPDLEVETIPMTQDEAKEKAQEVTGISAEEAEAAAQEFFGVMGADMRLQSVSYASTWSRLDTAEESAVERGAYGLHFTRNVEGADLLYDAGTYAVAPEPSRGVGYYALWDYETVDVYVTGEGIRWISWVAPLTITEVLPQTRELLPFAEIAAVCEEKLLEEYGGAYRTMAENEAYLGMKESEKMVYVDNVRLGYFRISDEGSVTRGTLIPVWGFYGGGITKTPLETSDEIITDTYPDPSPLLLVNALDGSVIQGEYYITPASL